ncbi:LuxR C-terminal-related transcriptional regulator [Micromonospora sp. AKA38]|uniref:LuxR C-terminal-related transcriptional regulator n=1 Tax=Micromonospora sp. AKA38 TaxID=2733861 RepID=UPI002491A789|nr:LuxR C-terminal-related transcriptional regulator [Micromonospora sp. AKA38]
MTAPGRTPDRAPGPVDDGAARPLVGRESELATLVALLNRVRAGRGGVVWLEGAAGLGKTALLSALLRRGASTGCTVRAGAGDDPRSLDAVWGLTDHRPVHPSGITESVDQVDAAVAALCASGPAVLALDDLHRAGHATVLAWNRISRSAARLPLLLVSGCRPTPYREPVATLRELVTQHDGELLVLGPLGDAEIVTVAAGRLGARPGPRLGRHLRALGGSPARVLGLLDDLDAAGLLRRAGGRVELGGDDDRAAAALDRYACAGVAEPNRPIVRMAALLGPRFDATELAAAGGLPLPAVTTALSDAVEDGVLGDDGDRLSFRHDVVRDAVARSFPVAARRAFHRAGALALLATGAEAGVVARHLRESGELPPAARDWLAQLPESTLLTDPALFSDVLGLGPVDARRCMLDHWLGRHRRAARTALALAATAEARPGAAADLRRLAVRALVRDGSLAEVDAICADTDDPRLAGWHAVALAGLGQLAAARERIRGLAGAPQDGPTAAVLALARVRAGDGRLVADHLAAVRDDLGGDSESAELRGLLHGCLIDLLVQTGPPDALAGAILEAGPLAARTDPGLAAWLRATAARAGYLAGRWDLVGDAEPGLAALVARHRSPPDATTANRSLRSVGREDELDAMAAEQVGDLAGALRARHRALAAALEARPARLHGAEHVVRLALAVGDDVSDVVRRCEWAAAEEALPVQLAIAALVRAMPDADPAALSRVVEQLSRRGAPRQHAYGLEELAVALARAGDRAGAGRALRETVRHYASVGSVWEIARADRRLGRYRVRRRTPADQPTSGWAALTPAEFRVVRLVARGMSNRDIADELYLSQNTVQTHLARIRAKLGVRSRLDIARAAGFQAEPGGEVGPVRCRRSGPGRST